MAEARSTSVGAAPLQTVERAMLLLQQFSVPGEAVTVTELARRLGVHRSSTSRIVGTLERYGMLERAPGGLVRLGPELARLGRVSLAGRELVTTAKAVMEQLARETGETATLSVPAGDEVLVVAQADGRHFVGSGHWIGLHVPPHCSSDGKLLLALGAVRLPSGPLPAWTSNTLTDPDALERDLEAVRRNGFAVAESELEDGLTGVAVPVRDGAGAIAALCLSGPGYRLDATAVAALAPACLEAAEEIESRMGLRAG